MIKIVKERLYESSTGAGFSTSGGFRGGMGGTTRGGFGGAWNTGGPASMYTYEIKPLNHILEPRDRHTRTDTYTIQIGSKITGYPIKSNAYPYNKKSIVGIVRNIIKSNTGRIMYYEIQSDKDQKIIKIDPSSVNLIIIEPNSRFHGDINPEKNREERAKIYLNR